MEISEWKAKFDRVFALESLEEQYDKLGELIRSMEGVLPEWIRDYENQIAALKPMVDRRRINRTYERFYPEGE